jgi:polysaccharide pyruvyl transferase WcaK-like protein
MTLDQFLDTTDLDNSLLIGYYGGGNFGDELLLEVLQNLLHDRATGDISITYKDPASFSAYHHDFGYKPVSWKLSSLVKAWLGHKQIVVGGGGLWGLDADLKILILSFLLFASRIFGKKVYLPNVGFYNSTPRIGRLAAWFSAKAARTILARDQESYNNFKRLNKRTYLDRDMAWYVREIDLEDYREDAAELADNLKVLGKTIFLCIRHFKTAEAEEFTLEAEKFIAENQDKPIIAATLESPQNYPEGYEILRSWKDTYPNVQIFDSCCNPLALYAFMQKHRENLALVAPQFHAILTAHMHSMPFLPIVYDNKVAGLLRQIGTEASVPIESIRQDDIQLFTDKLIGESST